MVDVNPQILRFEWDRHSLEQWHMWHRDTSVFYEDFDLVKNEVAKKQNRVIMELVRKKELKAEDVENYKREHPVTPADIYKNMAKNFHLHPDFSNFLC